MTPELRFDQCVGKARVRLFEGDCVTGMEELAEGSIDLVVTSPPYNLGIRYGAFDDTLPRDQYLAWTRRWGEQVRRVLSPRGSFFLNVGGKPSDPWVPLDVALCFRELFCLQNVFHWVKSIAIDEEPSAGAGHREDANGHVPLGLEEGQGEAETASGRNVIIRGHYKPINSPRFVNDCQEYVFHFTRTGDVELDRLAIGVPYQDKSNVSRWAGAGSDLHCRGNTWFIPYETIQRRATQRPHPATFPPRLPEMCLLLHGRDRVREALDPFLGLGNSALAAVRQRVSFVGFEIDPQYLETACERVEAEVGRTSNGLLKSLK